MAAREAEATRMLERPLHGILPVMATVFTPDDAIDEGGCRSVVRYNLRAGAHGIVTLGHASEFASLTEAERAQVARITVEEVAGAVPVVVGASGTSAATAALAARDAQRAGADALMVMPPYLHRARPEVLDEYFAAVTAASDLPIVLQNSSPPFGNDLSASQMAALIRRHPSILYVKEETRASTHVISALIAELGAGVGVMGAESGRFMIQHHCRGACAIMPNSIMTELYITVWNALEGGDVGAARVAHARLLPLLNFFGLHGIECYKEVLAVRGLISSSRTRGSPFLVLDELDRAELRELVQGAGLGALTPAGEIGAALPA